MEKLHWISTVVGSFPYLNSPENMEAAFWDQINNGVDYPCYPQLVSMIDQFLDPLMQIEPNLQKNELMYSLEGDMNTPSEAFATEYGKFVVDFFANHPEAQDQVKGWKACLTGPFTLAGAIQIPPEMTNGQSPVVFQEPRAIMNADLLYKLADMMAMIAKVYNDMGASIISMDEPSLTLLVGRRKILFHEEDLIINVLNRAIAPIEKFASVHICGSISPLLRDILLKSNVKILDHEFVNGSNDAVFEKSMFDESDKSLAYGILESSVKYTESTNVDDYVETPETMETRIQKAVDQFGAENLIFKPDCGFGGLRSTFGEELAQEIVRRKLKVLSETMKKFPN